YGFAGAAAKPRRRAGSHAPAAPACPDRSPAARPREDGGSDGRGIQRPRRPRRGMPGESAVESLLPQNGQRTGENLLRTVFRGRGLQGGAGERADPLPAPRELEVDGPVRVGGAPPSRLQPPPYRCRPGLAKQEASRHAPPDGRLQEGLTLPLLAK